MAWETYSVAVAAVAFWVPTEERREKGEERREKRGERRPYFDKLLYHCIELDMNPSICICLAMSSTILIPA